MDETRSVCADLVTRAQAGDSASMATLAELVRERVYPYVRRVVLDEHKSEDLVQDISVSILQSLGALKQADRFWSWVFSIATNRIRERFRRESLRKTVSLAEVGDDRVCGFPGQHGAAADGPVAAQQRELVERTQQAMGQISERQRMVLSLRFYENMPHAEIAGVLGCSELTARVTFFNAKRALLSQLRRLGIDKTAFGAALLAFGHLTLPPKASAATVVVSSSAVNESMITGLLTAKLKAACALVLVSAVTLVLWSPGRASTPQLPPRPVAGVHFVHQSLLASSAVIDFRHTRSQGAYESWYSFPEGPDGPFLLRVQRWDPRQKDKLCWWVQGEDANYYVHSGQKVVYVSNYRMTSGSHATRVLPTDSEEFCRFVGEVEGAASGALVEQPGLTYERDPKTGRLLRRVDGRFESLGAFETRYEYGDVDQNLFSAPVGMPVVDERDAMHKRGWTWFRIAGQIEGKGVAGAGRIPFTYRASRTHPAWLRLSVDGREVAVDDGKAAVLSAGGTEQRLRGQSLFKGLARPWTGFHTMDVVRRDAATERLWFSAQMVIPDEKMAVSIHADRDRTHYSAYYHVDISKDVLEQVTLVSRAPGGEERYLGSITFSYLQDVQEDDPEFAPPVVSGGPGEQGSILWLLCLADGDSSLRSIQ